MKCPSCITSDLVKAQREGIQVDYCPTCNGMWLNRGELDKVVSKVNELEPVSAESTINGTHKTMPAEGHHHSPILDNIESSRELHRLHMNGKHHWMRRLFS